MARRRTVFHFQSQRLSSGDMLFNMFIIWAAKVALWLIIGLIALIGAGIWWLVNKLRSA